MPADATVAEKYLSRAVWRTSWNAYCRLPANQLAVFRATVCRHVPNEIFHFVSSAVASSNSAASS